MLTSGVFGYLFDYLVWWVLFISLIVQTWCFFRVFPISHRRLRLILGNVLVFLCLLGAAAMAGESYFRFVAVQTDSFGMSLPARRWFALHTKLNSLGCRDKEWALAKPPGVRRIAFVGDSFTYGWGIENPADRFTGLIQAHFDRHKPGSIEVMNVAKPGWGTGDEIQPIIDMIEMFDVDEIILCHVPNDIEKLLPRSPDFDPIRPPTPAFVNLDSSPLLDFLYRRVYLPRVPTVAGYHDWLAEGYANPEIWSRQRGYFEQITNFCRKNDVVLRVVLLPYLRVQGSAFDQRRIHEQIRTVFASLQVSTMDLLPGLESQSSSELVVNAADAHPNGRANQMIAGELIKTFWPALDSNDPADFTP